MKSRSKSDFRFIKRSLDLSVSVFGLLILSPILILALLLVWIQDWSSPIYVANRVGKNEVIFKMYKIRSMVVRADSNNVDSTSSTDMRITKVGRVIRKLKLDEITQLINVLRGEMSLVGPRPNVIRDVNLYTSEERNLLTVKPGITDFASIVFSDEGEILSGYADPDLAYNQVIRPIKSRLGLHYVKIHHFSLDIALLFATFVVIFSRKTGLAIVTRLLISSGAGDLLIETSRRLNPLKPLPPPGGTSVIKSRNPDLN